MREARFNPTPSPLLPSSPSQSPRALARLRARAHKRQRACPRARVRAPRAADPVAAARLPLERRESWAPARGVLDSPDRNRVPVPAAVAAFRAPPAGRSSVTKVRHPFVSCLGAQALLCIRPPASQTCAPRAGEGGQVFPSLSPSSTLQSVCCRLS